MTNFVTSYLLTSTTQGNFASTHEWNYVQYIQFPISNPKKQKLESCTNFFNGIFPLMNSYLHARDF